MSKFLPAMNTVDKLKISFVVNGKPVSIEAKPDKLLLDVLREDLNLTGTKEGCRTGDCGACSVLLDGKLVNSCMVMICQVEGREVLTIEGIGSRDNLHPIQKAFISEAAVQCGFCTPGFILASKALLDANPHPGESEIKQALSGNLCRCTGYRKIIEAVKKAASELRKSRDME